ncbi:MAG: Ig-like domain-containing protein, partial [Gemmatimonadaceae bacterium]
MQLSLLRRAAFRAPLSRPASDGLRLPHGRRLGIVSLALILAACGGGSDGGGPKATALRVDPASLTIDVGATLQLTATPVDNQGSVVVNTNPVITWRSLAPAIASVDEGGLVTAVSAGTASIEAKAGSLVGSASITVNRPPVGRVSIDPGTLALFRGGTGQLSAKVFTDGGVQVTDRSVAWTSLNETIASVTATGVSTTVTAKAPGSVAIRATSEGISSEVTVFVGADPIIVLSAPSLDLSLGRLATQPAEGTIQIANGSAGTLSGLSSASTYATGEPSGWLDASLSSTSQPSTLTLRANAGSLGEGVYHATVAVSSSLPAVAPKSVAVKLTVGPGPAIALSSAAVSLTTFAGAPPSSSTAVTVSNGGGSTLSGLVLGSVTWSGPANWATFTLSGPTAPASLTITPTATIATLAAGSYSATVPVTSTLSGVASRNVVVTLTVGAAPVIALSPPNVSFTAALNGNPPASQQVTLSNTGGGTLGGVTTGTITYTGGANGWLTATLQNAASATPTVLLAVNNAGVATGTYHAVVPVTSSNTFVAAKQIDVTLNVGAIQVIAVATPSMSITATQGGANPTAATVAVTNGGTGSLTGLSVDPVTYTGGASGWMTASIASGAAPTNVSLNFSTGGLAVGSYTATVVIRSTIPLVIPASIVVALTVRSGATIALSSAAVTIQGLSGGTNPPSTNVNITNGAIGTLTGLSLGSVTYGGGQPAGWLTPTLSGSTAPATVTLAASVAGLAAGTYTASLPVQTSLAGVTDASIAVTLVVNPATTMAVSSLNVTMNAPNGGGNPAAVPLSVTNTGANPLIGLGASVTYTGSPPANWLSASVSPTSAPATLTLSANVALLPSGTYLAQVQVSSPVATNSPQTVNVTLVVPPPTISLSTTTVSAVATQSVGVATTPFNSVAVTNSGGGILQAHVDSVHYTSGSGWLVTSISPSRAPSTLSISVNSSAASL